MLRSRGFKFIFVCGYPVVQALFSDGAGTGFVTLLQSPQKQESVPGFPVSIPGSLIYPCEDAPSSEPSATVSSKVRTHELSSVLFFIFKTVTAILDPSHFRIQNLNQLFNFCKAVNRDCKKDCLEFVDQSGEYCLLNNTVSSNPWACGVPPFMKVSVIVFKHFAVFRVWVLCPSCYIHY